MQSSQTTAQKHLVNVEKPDLTNLRVVSDILCTLARVKQVL